MENATTDSALRRAAGMMVAARKQELRIHPSPDELVAYHARALSGAHSDRVQDHISFCRECSRVVMQLAPEIGAARHYSPISDQHVCKAWEQFVERLASASDQGAEPPQPQSPAPLARRSSLAALAALLIAAAGLALFSVWILRSLPQPQANVSLLYLNPAEDRIRSAEEPPAHLAQLDGDSLLVLQSSTLLDRFSSLFVTIERLQGSGRGPVWRLDGLRPDSRNECTVLLRRGSVPAGQYQLRLFGVEDGQESLLGTYAIQVKGVRR